MAALESGNVSVAASLLPSIVTASVALLGASLAILSSYALESYKRHRDMQGIAGAIHGEISAIVRMTKESNIVENLSIIKYNVNSTNPKLNGMSSAIPNYHPVYDKIADKIGVLPADIPEKVSMFYNYLFGFRRSASEIFTGFYDKAEFSKEIKSSMLEYSLLLIKDSMKLADVILPELQKISKEKWFKFRLRFPAHRAARGLSGKPGQT